AYRPTPHPHSFPTRRSSDLTGGYGRSDSRDGSVFTWNFIALGTYWTAADVAIQHIAKELGGMDKLKGKKIALVYHDSPYGKEPRSEEHTSELQSRENLVCRL